MSTSSTFPLDFLKRLIVRTVVVANSPDSRPTSALPDLCVPVRISQKLASNFTTIPSLKTTIVAQVLDITTSPLLTNVCAVYINVIGRLLFLYYLFTCLSAVLYETKPIAMDSTYLDHMYEQDYSQTHRSRSESGVSTTEALFHSLKLAESQGDTLDSNPYTSRPQSSEGLDLASRAHIRPGPPTSRSFLSTPSIHRSYSQSNLSRISEPILSTSWSASQPHYPIQGAPQLHISPPTSFPELRRSASSSNTQTASMRCASALEYH